MSAIKKDDQVQLKSGGPLMTVQNIDNYSKSEIENGALCIWFDDKKPMEKVFDVATLEIYREDYDD
jgi:uncharacterized protein YodC (DUF2158 family)